jgi:hypothetical protein
MVCEDNWISVIYVSMWWQHGNISNFIGQQDFILNKILVTRIKYETLQHKAAAPFDTNKT